MLQMKLNRDRRGLTTGHQGLNNNDNEQ